MEIIHGDEGNFDTVLAGHKNVLVDFWAPWCGPCRMVGPLMEQIAGDYDGVLAVMKVDIDQNPALAQRFGVQSSPTILLFREGELVRRDVGARPMSFYQEMLSGL